MVYATRRETFNAAHRLFREEWSDEKNLEVFGACSNPNWHGHNYELTVTVAGPVNEETGFVINLKDLSQIINERVISKVDHKNLNLEVPFMAGRIPSTENLVKAIWDELAGPIMDMRCALTNVGLRETENNYCEYRGD